MTESEDSTFNKPLFQVIYNYGESTFNFIVEYLSGHASTAKQENKPQLIPAVAFCDQLLGTFFFNDLQLLLLKTFLCILLVTLLLVVLSWRVYGKKISDRFLKPGERRDKDFSLASQAERVWSCADCLLTFNCVKYSSLVDSHRETEGERVKAKTTQRLQSEELNMAEKIKKFFARKKADAKFKLAGPGHKLSETSTASNNDQGKRRAKEVRRGPPSEESKVAAQAALERLSQRRTSPAFNTSLAAIQAQVKRELEDEAKASKATELNVLKPNPKEYEEISKHLATNGVYFRCPMISNEVLPRDEWKRRIKEFLYEQLEEERGLTACLIIHSCNKNREKVTACVETLCKYLENIVTYPEEEKYQKIRMSNRVFADRVAPVEGAVELLLAAGFSEQTIANADGVEEPYFVFDAEYEQSIERLITLTESLRSAEPIQLELDRSLQVLLPSQAAARMDIPPEFYSVSPEELKREQQNRLEAMEKSQLLRTKAMRERDELREMRKYKFALIRVRFPDGILLQGTFSVYEKYNDIHDFVAENLEHGGLPFTLNDPTGHRFNPDEVGDKTLIDLRLVPASVLIFSWDPSVAVEISNSPNRDVYLKPELMILVQEV